jgi:hypothetical protein
MTPSIVQPSASPTITTVRRLGVEMVDRAWQPTLLCEVTRSPS